MVKSKTMKYADLIAMDQNQKDAEKLQYQVEDNQSQLEADLKETKRSLITAKRELVQLKSKEQLSSQDIIKQIDLIESFEKGIEKLEALIKELF